MLGREGEMLTVTGAAGCGICRSISAGRAGLCGENPAPPPSPRRGFAIGPSNAGRETAVGWGGVMAAVGRGPAGGCL